MATETVQTTQSKQPGKQEYKEEIKTDTSDIKTESKTETKTELKNDAISRIGRAESIINRHVMYALGAGVIPVPVVDVLAVTGVEVKMLKELSELYGLSFKESAAKKLIYSLMSGLGAVGLGGVVGVSLAKMFPSVGTAIGVISVPVFAAAFTRAVGKMFLMHFESGGTVLDFDPHAMRSYFKSEYEKAKDTVSRMQKDEPKATTTTTTTKESTARPVSV